MYRRKPGGNWTITVGGRRVSSGTADKERARRKEQKDNAGLWDKGNGFVILTWDDACNAWIDANPGPWAMYHNQKHMAWWRERLSGKRLPDINRVLIHGIVSREFSIDPVNRVPANATANSYVAFAARIVRHGSGIRPDFVHYPPTRFRERYLKPEEWVLLAAKLDQDSLDVFTYILATGVREANCIFMEWAWRDGSAVTVPAERFKSRVPHSYPLNRTAQAVLERRKASAVKNLRLVFTRGGLLWTRKTLLERLHGACAAAGIEDIVVHGLRHTFNTWLAKAGVPKEIRMRLMGHSSGDVHDGYTHWDVEALRPAAETIDRVIGLTYSSPVQQKAVY